MSRWGGAEERRNRVEWKEVIEMKNAIQSQSGSGVKAATPKGLEAEIALLIKGVSASIPDGSSLTVATQSWTKQALVAELQKGLDLYQKVKDQVQALKEDRQARLNGLPAIRKLAKDLRHALIGTFGHGSPMLEQFGIKVAVPVPLTAEQQALRVARLRATRAARHTLGPRQKQAIRGVVATTPSVASAPVAPVLPGSSGVNGPSAG
jgi:hypothetical protein